MWTSGRNAASWPLRCWSTSAHRLTAGCRGSNHRRCGKGRVVRCLRGAERSWRSLRDLRLLRRKRRTRSLLPSNSSRSYLTARCTAVSRGSRPMGTPASAAIAIPTAALVRQPTSRRLLLRRLRSRTMLTDYGGPYGVEDTRQAVAEARAQDVDAFCLTVDREAPRYASRIFGRAGFGVLRRPDQLSEVLVEVLRRMIRP